MTDPKLPQTLESVLAEMESLGTLAGPFAVNGNRVRDWAILIRAAVEQAQPADHIHTCSYYCDRPECLKAQRDELRDRLEGLDAEKGGEPPPNWCRTCGKHWSDPMAIFCSDGIHNPNKPTTPPAQAAEAVLDKARMDWLSENFMFADFDYGHGHESILGIQWPKGLAVSAGLRRNVDAAIAAMQAGEGKA